MPASHTITDDEWMVMTRTMGLSPQQGRIARMIREEDLGSQAIALRLPPTRPRGGRGPGARKGRSGRPARDSNPTSELEARTRSVETQIRRMYRKLTKSAGKVGRPEVRSRAALVDRIWVEYWRMRDSR